MKRILCTTLLAVVLTACTDTQTPGGENNAPVGRLGDNVVPTKYAIELTVDPSLESYSGVEMARIVARQMVRAKTTELTYAWIRENDVAVIGRFPERFRSGFLPGLGSAFCSAARADEWQNFIEAHADSMPGYERSLAQATESVRLCAALREASADGLVTAFGAY